MEQISRREALTIIGGGVAGAMLGIVLNRMGVSHEPNAPPSPTASLIRPEQKRTVPHPQSVISKYSKAIEGEYDVKVYPAGHVVVDPNSGVECGQPKLTDQSEAVEVIYEEIYKYPPEYIQRIGVNSIELCDPLGQVTDQGTRWDGGHLHDDTIRINPGFSAEKTASTFHHEMEHAGGAWDPTDNDLEEWLRYSDEGESGYIDYEEYYRLVESDSLGDLPSGFARHYGRVSNSEDRAVTAEVLMLNSQRVFSDKDNWVLIHKASVILKDLERRSGGRIGINLLNDLMEGNEIGNNYWCDLIDYSCRHR